MSGARILVVDDEEGVRWALTKALQGAGHRVEPAADGEAGLAAALDPGIALVLLDVRLQGAPVLLHDAQRDGQAQPRPLGLGGEERREQLGLRLR